MKKVWNVTADGVKHTIEYKTGFGGSKVVVDGEPHRVKSSSIWVNQIDYAVQFGNTECHLVVIGNKGDVAINGVFLDSKDPYTPLTNAPKWIYILAAISAIGGFLLCGLIGCLIGILFSSFYVKAGLKQSTGGIIGAFIACTVIQLILTVAVGLMIV